MDRNATKQELSPQAKRTPMHVRRQDQVEKPYPRAYQMDAATRRVYRGLAMLFFAISLVPILRIAGILKPPRSPLSLALTLVPFFAFPTWLCFLTAQRVIFHADAIEVAGWLSSRKLRRTEIRGWRMSEGYHGGAHYIMLPVDKNLRALHLPPYLHTDEMFRSWMNAIPQLKLKR